MGSPSVIYIVITSQSYCLTLDPRGWDHMCDLADSIYWENIDYCVSSDLTWDLP